jgi:hypothetical protein
MKTTLASLLTSLAFAASALAHGVELGPNGGRLLEFSKNETTHGEVTLKDGKFHIAVLDKDLKPVALGEQTITANGGPTGKAAKLEVTKDGNRFVVPAVKKGEWLILQFKENAKAKAVTARLEYNTSICPGCKAEEWICKCKDEDAGKKK